MILNSWKEIATYLRCSVRTAQRLERAGMPVRRPAGHLRSAVVAFSEEIAIWLEGAKLDGAKVAATVLETERQRLLRAEMVALRARMAECRARSHQLRQRALAIRTRQRFTAPIPLASESKPSGTPLSGVPLLELS